MMSIENFRKDCGLISINDETYSLYNLEKPTKSRTINNDGWRIRIKTEDIRISPQTYWEIGRYDHQFEASDAYCYLCKTATFDDSKCKCPEEGFTVKDHFQNVLITRRNYLKSYLNQFNFDENLVDNLSDEKIDDILYKKNYLFLKRPPLFDFRDNYKTTNKMIKYLNQKLGTNQPLLKSKK